MKTHARDYNISDEQIKSFKQLRSRELKGDFNYVWLHDRCSILVKYNLIEKTNPQSEDCEYRSTIKGREYLINLKYKIPLLGNKTHDMILVLLQNETLTATQIANATNVVYSSVSLNVKKYPKIFKKDKLNYSVREQFKNKYIKFFKEVGMMWNDWEGEHNERLA